MHKKEGWRELKDKPLVELSLSDLNELFSYLGEYTLALDKIARTIRKARDYPESYSWQYVAEFVELDALELVKQEDNN